MDLIRFHEPGGGVHVRGPGRTASAVEGLVDAPPRLLHGAGRVDRVLHVLDALVDALPRALCGPLGLTTGEGRGRPEQQCGERYYPVRYVIAHPKTSSIMTRFRVVPAPPAGYCRPPTRVEPA